MRNGRHGAPWAAVAEKEMAEFGKSTDHCAQVADDRKSMNRSHTQVTFKRHSWLQKYAKLDFKLSLSQFFANGKSPGTGEIAVATVLSVQPWFN
jgi:hypothetical protein